MPVETNGGLQQELRRLPAVEKVSSALAARQRPGSPAVDLPAPLRVMAAREAVADAAVAIRGGRSAPSLEDLVEAAELLMEAEARLRLCRVLNATGVLLHTNLGRAPLAPEAIDAARRIGTGYSNLEFDLALAKRGSRYEHAAGLLKSVTGAQAALVVNNNAAAVLLAMSALAKGREVIVSRGELIEIGGEFRIPDIMAESGALLKEIGTTNRTHLHDYEKAIRPETAAILKVHPSNYRVVGFTSTVQSKELIGLAKARGLHFVNDLGSGLLSHKIDGQKPGWLSEEPSVAQSIDEGADVVTFSADKLLGGPQAGILLGSNEVIDQCSHSPLLRAFRVDKTTLAALEATLLLYLGGRASELPFWRMALLDLATIEQRAQSIIDSLAGAAAKIDLADGFSTPGGGSAPGVGIPTVLIEIAPRNCAPGDLARALVNSTRPILARIEDDRVVVDLRTIEAVDDPVVAEALRRLL